MEEGTQDSCQSLKLFVVCPGIRFSLFKFTSCPAHLITYGDDIKAAGKGAAGVEVMRVGVTRLEALRIQGRMQVSYPSTLKLFMVCP